MSGPEFSHDGNRNVAPSNPLGSYEVLPLNLQELGPQETHSPQIKDPEVDLSQESISAREELSKTKLVAAIWKDLQAAGITKAKLGLESVRSIGSEVLSWGAEFALLGLGLQAAADHSPLALVYFGVWAVASSAGNWCDRTGRVALNELDRKYSRRLYSKLIESNGRSSFKELDDEDRKAQLNSHWNRAEMISNLTEHSIELPGLVIKIALSTSVLLVADWKVAVFLAAALTPLFILKSKQTREDIELDERQRKPGKVADAISDEAFSTNGSTRLVLSRLSNKVQRLFEAVQKGLDEEKDSHERKQNTKLALTEIGYFAALTGGITMLFMQYQAGAFGIGVFSFLCAQLTDLAGELDSQSDKTQEYLDLTRKLKLFYGFTEHRSSFADKAFPSDHTINLSGVRFCRGHGEDIFEVTLPEVTLATGDFLVVHGASGAGKTTLLQHLAFAAKPESGQFKIGGTNAEEIDFDAWRENITYCGAVPALLEGLTIEQALSLDPEGERYLDERLKHPLVSDLIADLAPSRGIKTRIGPVENGRNFSTGELKRLMLVPALIGNMKIIILDEATANLNDALINTAIAEIERLRSKGVTVIFATHSKRFDDRASQILNVSKGEANLVTNTRESLVIDKDKEEDRLRA